MSYKETAYSTLRRINDIENKEARIFALRQELLQNNALAIIVQRTYHPNYSFELPLGPLPESIAKKSDHNEAGPLYTSLRKWYVFRPESESSESIGIKQTIKEAQFVDLYESVASDDAELLIGVKDKKLPFANLNGDFVVEAIPELFPESYSYTPKVEVEKTQTEMFQPVVDTTTVQQEFLSEFKLEREAKDTRSKKEICFDIIQKNPGLQRKEYLALFEKVGVSTATGGLYYQKFKSSQPK